VSDRRKGWFFKETYQCGLTRAGACVIFQLKFPSRAARRRKRKRRKK